MVGVSVFAYSQVTTLIVTRCVSLRKVCRHSNRHYRTQDRSITSRTKVFRKFLNHTNLSNAINLTIWRQTALTSHLSCLLRPSPCDVACHVTTAVFLLITIRHSNNLNALHSPHRRPVTGEACLI